MRRQTKGSSARLSRPPVETGKNTSASSAKDTPGGNTPPKPPDSQSAQVDLRAEARVDRVELPRTLTGTPAAASSSIAASSSQTVHATRVGDKARPNWQPEEPVRSLAGLRHEIG